ncbi:MAG TPA: hypothetical protein VKA38_06390 [Draconibacterium sp.]|nr:hypothetical protein [Draconibacterium sp.]
MLAITSFVKHFIEIWEKSPVGLPQFEVKYANEEQQEREKQFVVFQQKMNALKSVKKTESLRNGDPGKTFFPMFKAFLKNVFDFEQDQLEIILSDKFKDVSKDFFYKARAFGPELSPENIYQGMRNVWIMNGIQLMMDIQVEITPSIFGYSMIYPYSDNFLDDPNISTFQKQQFSDRFSCRLHGQCEVPMNHTEQQLFKLVSMFEQQYPRALFPKVYESLYAIQQGQTNSLKLMKTNTISDSQVKHIAFEKGGASVLADGYLVAGRLTEKQEQALFGYGVYLQLLDDIQDIKEDLEADTCTMFSFPGGKKLNEFVNKTIHFGRAALEEMQCFEGAEMSTFLRLMNRSIETMIIESVGMNPAYYSDDYLKELEKHSPIRFEFIRKRRSQSKSQRFSLFRKYFEQTKPEKVVLVED